MTFYLGHSADVNARATVDFSFGLGSYSVTEVTPLHLAIDAKNWELAEILLNEGAEPTLRDGRGRTALDYAEGDQKEQLLGLILGIKGREPN